MTRIFLLWLVGLVTIVPYAGYRLLFEAESDEYAFLIVAPLFWVFGFWGVVGPLVSAQRVRTMMKRLETGRDELAREVEFNGSKEVIVDLVARENRIPRFVVRKLYDRIVRESKASSDRGGYLRQ